MKGQVSAEMLILLAVVIAIVALAASALMKTAEDSSKAVEERAQGVLDSTDCAIAGHAECTDASDCSYGETCSGGCCRTP
ncbi:MAG: class III signal peptide-containing protein [Candidatus ainarchaeum sp.]|nr:class III signal peptide-containing protein [Candidatus ainarchaeum sp.]